MKLFAVFAAILALTACGAEAPPSYGQTAPGLTMGGEVRLGVRTSL